eukprot:gene12151-2216_t
MGKIHAHELRTQSKSELSKKLEVPPMLYHHGVFGQLGPVLECVTGCVCRWLLLAFYTGITTRPAHPLLWLSPPRTPPPVPAVKPASSYSSYKLSSPAFASDLDVCWALACPYSDGPTSSPNGRPDVLPIPNRPAHPRPSSASPRIHPQELQKELSLLRVAQVTAGAASKLAKIR